VPLQQRALREQAGARKAEGGGRALCESTCSAGAGGGHAWRRRAARHLGQAAVELLRLGHVHGVVCQVVAHLRMCA